MCNCALVAFFGIDALYKLAFFSYFGGTYTACDCVCHRFDKASGKYMPHNKAWIKEKIYMLLRQQAGKA